MVTKETIKEMAELAKLEFSEEELDTLSKQVNEALDNYKIIEEVDITNVDPLHQVNEYLNPMREDTILESLPQEEVIKNTVEEQYGYFKILKVVD